MLQNNSVSICLTIHNQEPIIQIVAESILKCSSEFVKEIICVFDGCTDNSEKITKDIFDKSNKIVKYFYAPDVWEVKANNITFKAATCPYILTLQDDMVLLEQDFDIKMLEPFSKLSNLLGTTARNAEDKIITKDGKLEYRNVAGSDVHSPRDVLYIRDTIVRGPIMFDHKKLRELNYLNEDFAPIHADDCDLCFRAWRKGYVVGAYMAGYISPIYWGTVRKHNPQQSAIFQSSATKNEKLIIERHSDLISGEKHSQDIVIIGE